MQKKLNNKNNKKIEFQKKATKYVEQIEILKQRGMSFNNESKAKHLFEYISYYRISGYWFENYNNLENKQFVQNFNFDLAFKRYCFDKKLRNILLTEIEKIEVAIRAKISYYWGHKPNNFTFQNKNYDNSFWFLDENNFIDNTKLKDKYKGKSKNYHEIIESIEKEYNRSKELFIESFKNKYEDKYPPTWILLEIISFGTLSQLYKIIKLNDKKQIANLFLLDENTFESWLHNIIYIRNICAHHSRLYNIKLRIQPLKNKKYNILPSFNSKVYSSICIIKYFLNIINPNTTFKNKLLDLFKEFPEIEKSDLGFEINWENNGHWK